MTAKQQRFVEEYLKDLNATQAAIRAGYAPGQSAEVEGARQLRNAKVADAIQSAMSERSESTKIDAEAVLRELWGIATADPNDLIEYRRTCCRHCWGENFNYQRTQREWEKAQSDAAKKTEEDEEGRTWEADPLGGIGYDERKAPKPDCPECFGEGYGKVFAKDTRNLSPAARKLYAGVKQTREGIELKMHDKVAALVNVGRHLGMFTDKVQHQVDVNVEDFTTEELQVAQRLIGRITKPESGD